MENQGKRRHKLSLIWREEVGFSAASGCPQHWRISPSFSCNAISVFSLLLFPLSLRYHTADRQSGLPMHKGCRRHKTVWPRQAVHGGYGDLFNPCRYKKLPCSWNNKVLDPFRAVWVAFPYPKLCCPRERTRPQESDKRLSQPSEASQTL